MLKKIVFFDPKQVTDHPQSDSGQLFFRPKIDPSDPYFAVAGVPFWYLDRVEMGQIWSILLIALT